MVDREVGNVRMINMARDFTLNVHGSQHSRHLRDLSSLALSLFFFFFGHVSCRILVPQPGIESWVFGIENMRVLTTGLPWNPPVSILDLLLACSFTLRVGWRVGEWEGLPGREWNDYGAFHLQ